MTEKQRLLYDFLVETWRRNGYGPSYDEMMLALGTKSKGSVHRIAKSLVSAGYLVHQENRRRSVRPVLTSEEVFRAALKEIEAGTQDPVAVAREALGVAP